MWTDGGNACTGCVVLKLKADGTGTGTDKYGYFTGQAGTYRGTWEYAGGKLYLQMTNFYDVTTARMPSFDILNLIGDGGNINVYVRQ